jgi:lipoyl synthase
MLTAQKPLWLNKTIRLSDCTDMKLLLRGLSLNTVCEEAACPNISECFGKGRAAFMILGRNCTRHCRFCNVGKGHPSPVDDTEPAGIAEAAKRLRLKHIVVTSVTRDDLPDGGAGHFANTVSRIRKSNIKVTIEVLVPDFNADIKSISIVVESMPDIINHNIETVPRLYPCIRPEADYERSLNVLKTASELSRGVIYTKSGIMLGFGEGRQEVLDVLKDLKEAGCQFLSIGQYLSPGREYLPVKEYVLPELFEYYKIKAQDMGFKHVVSAPYARSSYLADEYIELKSEPE